MMEDPLIEKNNGLKDMSADDGGSSHDENEDKGSMGSDAFTTPLAQYKPHDDLLGLRQRRRTEAEQSSHHDLLKNSVDEEFEKFYSTEGSVGSNAFTTPLAQYKPHDDLLGLQRRRKTNVGMLSLPLPISNLRRPITTKLRNLTRSVAKGIARHTEDLSEDDFINSSLDLGEVDVDSQMISPRQTVIAAEGTEVLSEDDFINSSLDLGEVDVDSQMSSPRRTVIAAEGTEDLSEDDFINSSLDLGEVDVDTQMISPRQTVIAAEGTEVLSEDDFINSSLDLGEVDVDSQMSSPRRTVIAAEGTEKRSPLPDTRIDIPGCNSNDERKGWDFEWIFVITNVVLQSMSAIFMQLSSKYALFGMLLSYFALLTCIIEIIYEGHRHQQIPQRGKSFAILYNIVALACALSECVVTTINCWFADQIKLTVPPIILANGVLFSKILKYRDISISFKKSQ
ncbi:hypothetical protein LWI29_014777 [Acer saccharum]|uniref:Uncharacterized protein n=1 Tax=Acer saccharum TaxID=4024 RepID=A0AA39RVA0_ACESA|nr:hypothetical protein LWI29_014777 [Acer saccharum]